MFWKLQCNNIMDCTRFMSSELQLESISSVSQYQNISTIYCWNSKNIYYSDVSYDSSHLFWCIWLRNKSYCIFNKQYTKEDYEVQVAKIIAHMIETKERGEFFHPSLSLFGYNETVAQEYFPIQKWDMNEYGYHRSDYSSDPVIPAWSTIVNLAECSDEQLVSLRDDPDVCKKVYICAESSRPFILQKAEIDFYQKHHLPLPKYHPDIRHQHRMKLRPWRTLYLRTCDCCRQEMLSVYDTDHQGRVYCESCYQKEVYG